MQKTEKNKFWKKSDNKPAPDLNQSLDKKTISKIAEVLRPAIDSKREIYQHAKGTGGMGGSPVKFRKREGELE